MTVPEARKMIASYVEPARKDNGPRMPGHTIDAFAEEFLKCNVRFPARKKLPRGPNRCAKPLRNLTPRRERNNPRIHPGYVQF